MRDSRAVTYVIPQGAILEETEEIASCQLVADGATCNRPGKVFRVLEGDCEPDEVCFCSVCVFNALGPAEDFPKN